MKEKQKEDSPLPGQKAPRTFPGLEGAPRTGRRRGQARTIEDKKERREELKCRLKDERWKGIEDGYVIDRLRKDPVNIFTMCYTLAN